MERPRLFLRLEVYELGEIPVEVVLTQEQRSRLLELRDPYTGDILNDVGTAWISGELPMPLVVTYYAKENDEMRNGANSEIFSFGYPLVSRDAFGSLKSPECLPPQERLSFYFESNPAYRIVTKLTMPDDSVCRESFDKDAAWAYRKFRFDPETLKKWDPEIIERVRQLPDHVLDVIGYHEVFPKTEEAQKPEAPKQETK